MMTARCTKSSCSTAFRPDFRDHILRKRENFRRAFDGFVPEKIARYRPPESRS